MYLLGTLTEYFCGVATSVHKYEQIVNICQNYVITYLF